MDLLANDLSVHEQFRNLAEFRDALARLMAMRAAAKRFGHDIHCHRAFLNTAPIAGMPLQQAIGNLGVESERRAVMVWLTRSGPFWDDVRQHGRDDWLECGGEIVTDTAVGEAAFRIMNGVDSGVVSVSPSDWLAAPLEVTWRSAAEGLNDRNAGVGNWWSVDSIEAMLRGRAPPLRSWEDLREASRNRFARLVFAEDCFAPLSGVPFTKAAADRFVVLLGTLDSLAGAFDVHGSRTAEGQRIYQDYFTGERAWFSDSSDREKRTFRDELTFAHPEDPARSLFCPWHGKISHSTLRLHFSWPIKAEEPVYVMYAGPKITKR